MVSQCQCLLFIYIYVFVFAGPHTTPALYPGQETLDLQGTVAAVDALGDRRKDAINLLQQVANATMTECQTFMKNKVAIEKAKKLEAKTFAREKKRAQKAADRAAKAAADKEAKRLEKLRNLTRTFSCESCHVRLWLSCQAR